MVFIIRFINIDKWGIIFFCSHLLFAFSLLDIHSFFFFEFVTLWQWSFSFIYPKNSLIKMISNESPNFLSFFFNSFSSLFSTDMGKIFVFESENEEWYLKCSAWKESKRANGTLKWKMKWQVYMLDNDVNDDKYLHIINAIKILYRRLFICCFYAKFSFSWNPFLILSTSDGIKLYQTDCLTRNVYLK